MRMRLASAFFAGAVAATVIVAGAQTLPSAAPPSSTARDADVDREVGLLVEQLGDEKSAVREEADAKLAALGAEGFRAIRRIHSKDPEVQSHLDQLKAKFVLWDGKEGIADYAKRVGIEKARRTLEWGDKKVSLNLALVPAGRFVMGSLATERYHRGNEVQHEVTISKPFYMGTTHVTRDQFGAFATDSGYKTDAEKDGASPAIEIRNGSSDFSVSNMVEGCSWRNPSFDQKGDHPAVQISWNDATAYCDWLSKKSGRKVVLPTEAQWEYACRAGTETTYMWGQDPDDGKGWANCADQSLKKSKHTGGPPDFFSWDDGFVTTSPVGSFKANGFGLFDMNGNVFQWCQDYYGRYEAGPVTDPVGGAGGDLRVVRGGTWNNQPEVARSAFRYQAEPMHRNVDYGFRVVVVIEDMD